MRDAERMKERAEVRLDDRQVAALAVAALLLLGAVFALGLQIGKTLALRAPRPAPVEPAALDAAAREAPPAAEPAPVPEAPRKVVVGPPAPASGSRESPPAPAPAAAALAPAREVSVPPPPPSVVVPPPAVQPAIPPPPAHLGRFTVQIGAAQDRAEAARLVSRARAAGLSPYVVEARLGARGTWYRVRVGAFEAREAAAKFRQDVERELRGHAVVMPAP